MVICYPVFCGSSGLYHFSYATLGSLKGKLWLWGIALGLGAAAGNWLGKRFLHKLSNEGFRKWVIAMMVLSGILLIVKQLAKF